MENESKTGNNTLDTEINTLGFRPVAFIPHDPEVWFAALETQFEFRRIKSQRQKYAHALECLPGDQIAAVRDVILSSNEPNPYDRLKEAILKHFLPSCEERLRALLARQHLGDAKPSHYLKRLQSLAGPALSNSDFLKELFMQVMPASVQPTLTALLEDTPLPKVAAIADKIVARTNAWDTPLVASTSRPVDLDDERVRSRQSCIHQRLAFKDRISIPKPVAQRGRSVSKKPPPGRKARSTSKPRKPTVTDTTSYCWFHRAYGATARRCRPPCSFPKGN